MIEYIIKQLQKENPIETLIVVLGLALICLGGMLLTSCSLLHNTYGS